MSDFVNSALFVYQPEAQPLIEQCSANEQGCEITAMPLDEFLATPVEQLPSDQQHLVVSASLDGIKQVLRLAMQRGFSLGIVPMSDQSRLRRYLDLPQGDDEAIALALQADPKPMDIALCNGEITLFRAIIGWMPALDALDDLTWFDMLKQAFSRTARLQLYPYRFLTANGKQVETACTGCMIVERHEGDLVSRLIGNQLSVRDGQVGLITASPFSMVEYLRFLYQVFSRLSRKSGLPNAVGYMQSREFSIESDKIKDVYIDGSLATQTPVKVKVSPAAARVNLGPALMDADTGVEADKETVRVGNLRSSKELSRSIGSRVPLFSYASEERFRDLFTALTDDAAISANYVVFILLSTCIATLGLYLNSAAVIIGAMILAPLMAPLVSVSMALLRANDKMFWQSLEKIGLGVCLALAAAALTSWVFPYEPLTTEMASRLHPSLPDLFVAIFSGVAAACSRSFKEISQNLAGVAIAVALVPPLSVAGIGIGRGDPWFFGQAFLLFSTNLVGIVLAATLTFRVLGFSPVLHARRRIGVVVLLLALIAIPLGVSSVHITQRWEAEDALELERFEINGKSVLITDVDVRATDGASGLMINIEVNQPLGREDLAELKRQIRQKLDQDFAIRVDVHYKL
ncbi:MAG: TIGR00341 family protein [Halieaceae bacterium]